MINKLKETIYIQRKVKRPVQELLSDLAEYRKSRDILVICPQATGANWLGVQNATKSIFDQIFIMPQYFSKTVYTVKELECLAKAIVDLRFNQVIFSGFCEYFTYLLRYIRKNSQIRSSIVFHGSLSEAAFNSDSISTFTYLLKSNCIDKVAFVKKDLANYFNELFGLSSCYSLLCKTRIPDFQKKQMSFDSGTNVGVFAGHNFNKNVHNQVAAGLILNSAKIHVIENNSFSFLQSDDRIIVHPRISHDSFQELLGRMTINSHISFSESWGQIVSESLANGVPCLTSDNNGIFEFDDFLASSLIVRQYDNPIQIANRMKKVIEDRDEISVKGIEYIEFLNSKAQQQCEFFIQG